MAVDLYMVPPSQACRSVLLLAKTIGLQLNPIHVDLLKGEHKEPKYLAVNPQGTVPTMVDHGTGLKLTDSHAIMSYLVDKYAPGNPVYPQDLVARARVHKWLYFDCGSIYPAVRGVNLPIVFRNEKPSEEVLQALHDKLKIMDTMLGEEGTKFAAGDNLTIADLALSSTLDTPIFLVPLDLSKYANLSQWYKNVQAEAEGYQEICANVLNGLKALLDQRPAKE